MPDTKNIIYLVTGNHKTTIYVQDIIEILKRALEGSFIIKISDHVIKNAANIIIDDFTNEDFNKILRNVKLEYPETKVIVVLTEFITTKLYHKSFNNFNLSLNIIYDTVVDYGFFIIKPSAHKFEPLQVFKFVVYFIPVLFFSILILLTTVFSGIFRKSFTKKFPKRAYMHLRYRTFRSMVNHFDGFICLHPRMKDGYLNFVEPSKMLGVVYPVFLEEEICNTVAENKHSQTIISGKITKYRAQQINEFEKFVNDNGLTPQFGQNVTQKSFHDKLTQCYKYYFYCPQASAWPYISPTAVWRSVAVYQTMLVSSFSDISHSINSLLAIITETSNVSFNKQYEEKLRSYNRFASDLNSQLCGKFKNKLLV
ncbi:hypothetical protein N9P87_01080 [bacterium]|nr:hypothetical protein [bacterium]